jgi:hypothetical protein
VQPQHEDLDQTAEIRAGPKPGPRPGQVEGRGVDASRIKPKRLRTISLRVRKLMKFLRVMAFGLLVLATLAELFGYYRKPIFLPPSWLLPSCHSQAPGSGR